MSTTSLNRKFIDLENVLNETILERRKENHTIVLAILARKHHFQIGRPGTAKSMSVAKTIEFIDGLAPEDYFHYLLTRYSTPDELYGPPALSKLKEDIFWRNTEGKLPRARFVFLDEIFKGNSSILNANLTAMNERKFHNHMDDPHINLITMFAASNELPQGEELNALWDRLHFRHVVEPIQESSNFVKMLQIKPGRHDKVVSLHDIYAAHAAVDAVEIRDDLIEAFMQLRETLKNEEVEPTERRWRDSLTIVQAEAFMNGREVADIDDMRPLAHVLWSNMEDRKKVERLVLDLANPIDREAQEILDRVIGLEEELRRAVKDADTSRAVAKVAIEVHSKVKKAKKSHDELAKRAADNGRSSQVLPELKVKIRQVLETLLAQGFGIDGVSVATD